MPNFKQTFIAKFRYSFPPPQLLFSSKMCFFMENFVEEKLAKKNMERERF